MTVKRSIGLGASPHLAGVLAGPVLVAVGVWAALFPSQWLVAGVAGSTGLAIWRANTHGGWRGPLVVLDFLAFAIFAVQRNDYLAFWQLVGPWADVFRFNFGEACIGLGLYLIGFLFELGAAHRPLRPVEAVSLIAIPFLFNLLVVMGADWHMVEIANWALPGNFLSFPHQVFVGRTVLLIVIAEAGLTSLSLIRLNRLPRSAPLHGLIVLAAALGAATPLVANAAQLVVAPFASIFAGALAGSLAQAGLWAVVYVATGLPLDALAGRPPRYAVVKDHMRTGFIKGAIYGGVFMALVFAAGFVLKLPFAPALWSHAFWLIAPLGGALAYPFGRTLIGSADGTPPFFGRLAAAYAEPVNYARGLVVGVGVAIAYGANLSAADGAPRFLFAFAVGALAYAGVDLARDAREVASGQRRTVASWRDYALGVLLGGIVAGAIGWYFDAPQLAKVIDKFWAYADPNYRASGRQLGDFMTYPLFNKYGAVNLGEVAGGVRLFWAESVAGVINWSLAAPLFSLNFMLLSALITGSLQPIREMFSPRGMQGLIEQAVRVMRWGLWMAPVINTFLRQSADPTWFNQDGAVRSLLAIGADVGLDGKDFRDFSLTLFLGLLAYDWLRVLIWFDHMGLRVATLVNLSFVGGDRADEAAARFLGYRARTRAIPDAIRRFGTWAPLLIPFYIPRGQEWDKVWSGAEALNHGAPMPGPIKVLLGAYVAAGFAIVAAAALTSQRMRGKGGAAGPLLASAPAALHQRPQSFQFDNGSVGLEILRDGRGAATVLADERGGFPIDLIRRPLDPRQARGHFFYLTEDGVGTWSIGFEPSRLAGEYEVALVGFNHLRIVHLYNAIRATLDIAPDAEGAVLSWKVRLEDVSGKARRIRLTSFCEVAGHETGAYARDLDFAGMHVETIFVRGLHAILARNRLLRSKRADRGETSFFAVMPGAGVELMGYEDSRTRFLGEGSLASPTGCEAFRSRKLDDQGKLWPFDPAASFTLETALEPDGRAEAEFIMGRADNAVWASELVSRRLGLPALPETELQIWLYETRALEPSPALPSRWPFAFAEDGATLHLTHRTPRPWAHVMANELGASVVVSNDGDIYSGFGNARHNGLTPFRFDSATTPQPGQLIYIRDLETGETDSPGFAPFQHADAEIEIAYEPGVARFTKRRNHLETTCEIFVPPDFPGDMRLLTLANRGTEPKRLRIVPFFDIALDESPNESAGHLDAHTVGDVLLFENRRNDFQRGVCFVATSLAGAVTETVRGRFFGDEARDITTPVMVETGQPDGAGHDDGRRVATFSAEIALAPGEETRIAIVIGQAPTRDLALQAAKEAEFRMALARLAATRNAWTRRLGAIHVKTNRPDFDRLVNTWLPYQLYASRLYGRVGPNQRGGAFGYRDQLQDVIPLIITEPKRARAQIVLHASQQFPEGDVLKWWHQAPIGGTGLGQRTKASDPHLWLPYVLTRYVEGSGDMSVLDVVTPYLEGPLVPEHEDTWVIVPRPSRESATVYDHAKLTIDFTLRFMGENGLPLLRAGDWNDGIDALGHHGRATGVWMGFFLWNVLAGFISLAKRRGDEAFAERCREAQEKLGRALEVGWRGDHYALDFADDGRAIDMPNAMTTGWAAYSGAVGYERAVVALEGGLKGIEREDRILLLEHPFFEHSQPYPGRIADYPPGVRENGGQYSHGGSWIIDGFLHAAARARGQGDAAAAARLTARAFEIWEKISPLKKTDPDTIATYGLIPIQQPADIYDGYGHGGRGGWSWYTGSAARMLSAAYGLLGIDARDGKISVAEGLFEPKGQLVVDELRIGDQVWKR